MPTAAVVYAPQSGHSRITLTGTIETDAQFSVQPATNDQIVYPSALTADAQLNISGPAGSYTLWHITAAGVVYNTAYEIVNLSAPVLSGATFNQITSTSLRFQVQTDKSGGTWYVLIGTSMPADGDVVSTGVSAAVSSAGVLSHTFSGLTAATLYYAKAVHVDADTNVSNYATASQSTYASGSISADVVYSPPAGYTLATLESGYDTYAMQQWSEVIADDDLIGVQFLSETDVGYFDSLGNFWFESLLDQPYWALFPDGTVYHRNIINKDQLTTAVPLDLADQSVTGAEINTWTEFPDQVVLTIADGTTATATIDNSQAQHRASTDAGATFGAYTSADITGLVNTDVLEYRMMSGAHYANSALGSDYARSANPSVAGVQFTLSVTNRNAVTPTITVQPQTQTVDPGDPVTLSVTANTGGTADPITYQWRKGGINISGATSSTYNIASAALSDAGSYSVRLQSAEGGVTTSATAVLSVTPNTNVFVESAEGLVDINALSTLLLDTEVSYEIWAGGSLVLSGTTSTDPVTGKLRIESVDTVIGSAGAEVELRYPNAGSTYYHAETVTVQAG